MFHVKHPQGIQKSLADFASADCNPFVGKIQRIFRLHQQHPTVPRQRQMYRAARD